MPDVLKGRILFLSDRLGGEQIFVLDPNTGEIGHLTARWPYDRAAAREHFSPNGEYCVVTRQTKRGNQLHVVRMSDGWSWAITFSPLAYHAVWSPAEDLIAFVSQEDENVTDDAYGSGGDEVYIIRPQGDGKLRLTQNVWEWDKHPSFSPDGSQIVFWTNRTGPKQLWTMNANGENQRHLLGSPYNDWDPIWVK